MVPLLVITTNEVAAMGCSIILSLKKLYFSVNLFSMSTFLLSPLFIQKHSFTFTVLFMLEIIFMP